MGHVKLDKYNLASFNLHLVMGVIGKHSYQIELVRYKKIEQLNYREGVPSQIQQFPFINTMK